LVTTFRFPGLPFDGNTRRFIEEPTAPDDILGHAAIRKALKPHGIGVATGEHAHNRMIFKQLLQAEAIDVCQIDSCRLSGVTEVLSVLLMAAKYVKSYRSAGFIFINFMNCVV
jgi:L-alanine-DL-glutamate epimerase-like enolase superfamily enzyme